jgi:hypothetical protein
MDGALDGLAPPGYVPPPPADLVHIGEPGQEYVQLTPAEYERARQHHLQQLPPGALVDLPLRLGGQPSPVGIPVPNHFIQHHLEPHGHPQPSALPPPTGPPGPQGPQLATSREETPTTPSVPPPAANMPEPQYAWAAWGHVA